MQPTVSWKMNKADLLAAVNNSCQVSVDQGLSLLSSPLYSLPAFFFQKEVEGEYEGLLSVPPPPPPPLGKWRKFFLKVLMAVLPSEQGGWE